MQSQSEFTGKVRQLLAALSCCAAACTAVAQSPAAADAPERALLGVWLPEAHVEQLLTSEAERPPLNEEAAALYEERIALKRSGDTQFDPSSWCAGPGMPRIMFMPYPFEILSSGDYVAFVHGWYRWHRSVDMAGAEPDYLYPVTMGFPTGRWEDDTLVIRTVGLSDVAPLDASGLPHSDEMVLTERLRLLPDDRLEVRFHIDDPNTYAAPWETSMTYRRAPAGTRVQDDICPDRMARGEPPVAEHLH